MTARGLPTSRAAAAWLRLTFWAASGCTRGQSACQRVSVTGTVTYQGHAVADGSISLQPVNETGGPPRGRQSATAASRFPRKKGRQAARTEPGCWLWLATSSSATGKSRPGLRQLPNVRQFERSVMFTAGSNTLRFELE
jgi:hypothetical protein